MSLSLVLAGSVKPTQDEFKSIAKALNLNSNVSRPRPTVPIRPLTALCAYSTFRPHTLPRSLRKGVPCDKFALHTESMLYDYV